MFCLVWFVRIARFFLLIIHPQKYTTMSNYTPKGYTFELIALLAMILFVPSERHPFSYHTAYGIVGLIMCGICFWRDYKRKSAERGSRKEDGKSA